MKFLTFIFIYLTFITSAFSHDSPYYSIKERVENAKIVFEGEVLRTESHWTKNRSFIYTKSIVKIKKLFKGNATSSIIAVFTKGGRVQNQFFMNTSSAFLSEGYEGLFFGIDTPYPQMSEEEFEGIRLLHEESGFIEYTGNPVGIKAVDNHHNFFNQFEILYDSIYIATREPYQVENSLGNFSKENICPLSPNPVITFSFDNIIITELGQFIEFDIMAKSNQSGVKFEGAEVSIKYPTNIFGNNIVQGNSIEVQKEEIIQDNNYSLNVNDLTSNKILISSNAIQDNSDIYLLTQVKEKFCHIKINISNLNELKELQETDIEADGIASYFCDKSIFPFQVDIEPFSKITYQNPNPELAVGLTYTFENVQILGGNNNFLSIDIYASSATPTYFGGGFIEISFNEDALSLSGANGFNFQRGEIIQNDIIYNNLSLNNTSPNIISVRVTSVSESDLFLLDSSPRKFGNVILSINDCSKPIELEFITSSMENMSDHFTDIDPIPWEVYSPIIANDIDNSTTCGCIDDPNISSFFPPTIIAGSREVLTITGTNFGTYDADVCRVKFPNGDEGGQGFNDISAEEGDIISWNDTEIKLYVPSTTGGSETFKRPACSGRIEVVNECGDDKTGLNEILTIPYAFFNYRKSSLEPASKLTIPDLDNEKGIQFRYATNVPQWIRDAFESALMEWCAITNIRFTISPNDINLNVNNNNGEPIPGDGYSTISMVDLVDGEAALLVGNSYLESCQNGDTGREAWYLKELDMSIDENNSSPLKVKNYMLHELGHAHMLQHSKDPTISVNDSKDNYLMFFSQTGFATNDEATIKNEDATGANLIFNNSFDELDGLNCPGGISEGNCGFTTSTNNLITNGNIAIFPNPNSGDFTLTLNKQIQLNEIIEWKIQDITGRQILQSIQVPFNKIIQIETKNKLLPGTYIFTLKTQSSIFSKKLIIHE